MERERPPGALDRFRILVWHFFGRFFDKESLSPQGEAEAGVIQTLGILAVPSAFSCFCFGRSPCSAGFW